MLALLCTLAQGAWAQNYDVWDGSSTSKPTYDSSNCYVVINTAAELAYINRNWDEPSGFVDGKDYYELDYYLNHDIDMWAGNWTPFSEWYDNTFYGNGHTIRYRIYDTEKDNLGLFAKIKYSAKVLNLNVAGSISCGGSDYVGGIAGQILGSTIQNCHSSMTIECGHKEEYGNARDVGGIVGLTQGGTIENCEMSGRMIMNKNESSIGGIDGSNSGICKQCWRNRRWEL